MFEALGMAGEPAHPHSLRLRGAAARPPPWRVGRSAGERHADPAIDGRRPARAQEGRGDNGRPNNRNKRNRGRQPRPREGRPPRESAQRPTRGGQDCTPRRRATDAAGGAPPRLTMATTSTSHRYPTTAADLRSPRDPRARQPRREISEDGPIPIRWSRRTTSAACRSRAAWAAAWDGGRPQGWQGGKAVVGERQPDPMQTSVGLPIWRRRVSTEADERRRRWWRRSAVVRAPAAAQHSAPARLAPHDASPCARDR